jgi:hypothetical protein
MSLHLSPPFRAEHIGSLKRPAALLAARAAFDEKKCSLQELKAIEDEAIDNIVRAQRDSGVGSISDGEFRRHMFYDGQSFSATTDCEVLNLSVICQGVFDNLNGMEYLPEGMADRSREISGF